MEKVISVAVDCQEWKYMVKVILDKGNLRFYKFPRDENLKQQWLIKIKRINI